VLAKVVNDNAGILNERGALAFFASTLAPTEKRFGCVDRCAPLYGHTQGFTRPLSIP
jgi:hypothetical protein